jgi:hypothetical protein
MSRNLFISYRLRDAELARMVVSFFQAQGGECEGRAVFADTDPTEGGESALMHEVNPLAQDCEAVLLVVGGAAHGGPWLDREVRLARAIELPIAAVHLPGTEGGVPAHIRGASEIPMVEWSSSTVCDALGTARRIR